MFTTPPHHSTTNGQVERFNSTLTEIARCTKLTQGLNETADLILLATSKYNRSVHSVTGQRPIDVVHSIPQQLREDIVNKIVRAQALELGRLNKHKKLKTYQPGDKVFVKTNKRIGNKLTKLYVENIIEQDLGTTVMINGKRVHKANLR